MSYRVITANRLNDGRVVYFGSGGEWVTDIARAFAFDASGEESWMARARDDESACVVVNAYAIEIEDPASPVPVSLRERIRSRGPTVETRVPGSPQEIADDAHV
jgi:sulfite reductase (NADPH) hemoprotein beta-component